MLAADADDPLTVPQTFHRPVKCIFHDVHKSQNDSVFQGKNVKKKKKNHFHSSLLLVVQSLGLDLQYSCTATLLLIQICLSRCLFFSFSTSLSRLA